jgi:hypothetical protein
VSLCGEIDQKSSLADIQIIDWILARFFHADHIERMLLFEKCSIKLNLETSCDIL